MKKCTVCQQELDYTYYHKSSATKDGYGYRCRDCDKKARASYREENFERFAEISRRKSLKWKYGITLEDYNEMLAAQNGCCAICGTKDNRISGRTQSFSVDHNHTTGAVRGLLCNQCNRALGMFNDSIDILEKAAKYLTTGNDTH